MSLLVSSPAAPATAASDKRTAALTVPLRYSHLQWPGDDLQPVTFGVPLPQHALHALDTAWLEVSPAGVPIELEGTILARWPDGSIKWLLLQGLVPPAASANGYARLLLNPATSHTRQRRPGIQATAAAIETGTHRLEASDASRSTFASIASLEAPSHSQLQLRFTDQRGRVRAIRWEAPCLTQTGHHTATMRRCGTIARLPGLRVQVDLTCYAGTGLVRAEITFHNARAARHRGGLWDLGDPGSRHFNELSLVVVQEALGATQLQIDATSHVSLPARTRGVLMQHASGGPQWNSRNHVDQHGRVPMQQNGYTWQAADAAPVTGARSSPVLATACDAQTLAVAVPDFWQQFPKAIVVDQHEVQVGLFPATNSSHELQGGERKRHTVWLSWSAGEMSPLQWVHQPATFAATREWHAATSAWPCFTSSDALPAAAQTVLASATSGERSLPAKREVIDEYGWRHYGDVWGDHEARFYIGEAPVISHYNNQFDLLYGTLVQWLHSSDDTWWQIAAPLARHVIDIDIYHTSADRPQFSGGLFWHTDHYLSAHTATHRTYSRANGGDGDYGGGPSCEHNYTTGLLHYYYLTGDPAAYEAVKTLADWVLGMEDGSRSPWRWLDDGPTGLATRTLDDNYHGPGRGAANSVQALLDAWELTQSRHYLAFAEMLIRRVVHPGDDLAALQLLDAEQRWSATMFLVALDRYLQVKHTAGEYDESYAYARQCLQHYACWMLEHERPYLDHPEQLQYVTETWAAQDLRKANVLRLAATDADPALARRLHAKADTLAEQAWQTLLSFPTYHVTRSIAIVATEAIREVASRTRSPRPAGPTLTDFGKPQVFVSSRVRAKQKLKSPRGLLAVAHHAVRRCFSRPAPLAGTNSHD